MKHPRTPRGSGAGGGIGNFSQKRSRCQSPERWRRRCLLTPVPSGPQATGLPSCWSQKRHHPRTGSWGPQDGDATRPRNPAGTQRGEGAADRPRPPPGPQSFLLTPTLPLLAGATGPGPGERQPSPCVVNGSVPAAVHFQRELTRKGVRPPLPGCTGQNLQEGPPLPSPLGNPDCRAAEERRCVSPTPGCLSPSAHPRPQPQPQPTLGRRGGGLGCGSCGRESVGPEWTPWPWQPPRPAGPWARGWTVPKLLIDCSSDQKPGTLGPPAPACSL